VIALSCLSAVPLPCKTRRRFADWETAPQKIAHILTSHSCACLIVDLKMPQLNGLKFQKLISADTTIPK
jgi:FixJ family two-component response regulator